MSNKQTQQETHICKWCGAETWQSDDECYAKPKTSVEQFAISLYENGFLQGNGNEINNLLEQAKAMHKEEIINATIYGDRFEGCYGLDSEQYYNETFGGNK